MDLVDLTIWNTVIILSRHVPPGLQGQPWLLSPCLVSSGKLIRG